MPVDHDAIRLAISAAEALGVTDSQLYALARVALADALKSGSPIASLTLPTGVSHQIAVEVLLQRLPDLRAAAQAETSSGIAIARGALP